VLGSGFGLPSGVVVDTHVGRISRRLGLTRHADAVRAERDLIKAIPKSHWIAFSHRLIEHGRTVCMARRPRCEGCLLADLCQRVGVQTAKQNR
jgi:endonuclease-3